MKNILILLAIVLFIITTACTQDESLPNERFDTYVKQWNDLDFANMYDMLTAESVKEYPTDQFIDRYKKVYADLDISNLKITYDELTKDEIKQAMKEGAATILFTVKMDSVAGPITFDNKATLLQAGDEVKDWYISWDPSFIFPELKDGEINIQTELPQRGEILDRNRMPLAINDLVYEIGIVPENLSEDAEDAKSKIAKLLNMSVEAIDIELNADWVKPNLFVPLKKVPREKESILAQLWELDGIMSRDATGRVYPLGESAAHLVGYVGNITEEELVKEENELYTPADMIGKRGLEQLFEEKLKGEKGVKVYITKEGEDDVILAEKSVKDGENISLTIDANIQEKIYDSYEGESGTAAAIDPKSGETLALISSPGFDPNEFLYGISQNEWNKLQDNPQVPLLNRFTATFAPGSVIKPISAAIGLDNGTIKPNEGIEINGLTWSNGEGWGDYKVRRVSSTSKPVDLADALIRSDNIYFAKKAVEMGRDAFISGLNQYGFEEKLPFEYPLVNSTISSSGTLDGEVQLANTSYGQAEVEMNTLHLALSYTPFLNDGNLIKPTLLTTEETGQVWHKELISTEHANIIQEILREVVVTGSGKAAQREGFSISGKTGTAELKRSSDEKGHENGWFVGYPTDKQDILIAMMIEHVENKGTSGLVAKKVADILTAIE